MKLTNYHCRPSARRLSMIACAGVIALLCSSCLLVTTTSGSDISVTPNAFTVFTVDGSQTSVVASFNCGPDNCGYSVDDLYITLDLGPTSSGNGVDSEITGRLIRCLNTSCSSFTPLTPLKNVTSDGYFDAVLLRGAGCLATDRVRFQATANGGFTDNMRATMRRTCGLPSRPAGSESLPE